MTAPESGRESLSAAQTGLSLTGSVDDLRRGLYETVRDFLVSLESSSEGMDDEFADALGCLAALYCMKSGQP